MRRPGTGGSKARVEIFGSRGAGHQACYLLPPGGITADR